MSRAPPSASLSQVGWVPSDKVREEYAAIMAYADPLSPSGQRRVGGQAAVEFFKRSGLPKETLRDVWVIADAHYKGFLELEEFCVACRLISMAQNGKPCTRDALRTFSWVPLPRPQFEGVNHGANAPLANFVATKNQARSQSQSQPQQRPNSSPTSVWAIDQATLARFKNLFGGQVADPSGMLPAGTAASLLSNLGLDTGSLKVIWDLAKTGRPATAGLDLDEFCVAMALAEGVARGLPLPIHLPRELTHSQLHQIASAVSTEGFNSVGARGGSSEQPETTNASLSAQAQADAMLAQIDAEETAKAEAIANEKRKREEEELARKQAQELRAATMAAEEAAGKHRRALLELQHIWRDVVCTQHDIRQLNEQRQRVQRTVMWCKVMVERSQEERARLKAEMSSGGHRLSQVQIDHDLAREELVKADTELQGLRFQLDELKSAVNASH